MKRKYPKPKLISFRDEVSEIDQTTYLTHSLYYHPAKFIPQTVKFCLDNYCKRGGVVLDPFGGSGTTGLEASIRGYKSYLVDINPLLDIFYDVKMHNLSLKEWGIAYEESKSLLIHILTSKSEKPELINENIRYWYPEVLLDYFCNVWTNYHNLKKLKNPIVNDVITLVLFKISKKYSFAEHSMPKLFISKRKRAFIEKKMLEESLFNEIEQSALTVLNSLSKSITSLIGVNKGLIKSKYFVGVDASEFDFNQLPRLDCIITSPPYLQAQEYIRTFQLEMMWKGISQDRIREYKSKEIPFRKAPSRIKGEYIDKIRGQISKKALLKMYDSYFWHTIRVLENASKKLKKDGKICVLIGNPRMQGIKVEIWKVIYEYFINNLDFNFVEVFDDRIKARKLFKGRSNLNPGGMKSEYLIILSKR